MQIDGEGDVRILYPLNNTTSTLPFPSGAPPDSGGKVGKSGWCGFVGTWRDGRYAPLSRYGVGFDWWRSLVSSVSGFAYPSADLCGSRGLNMAYLVPVWGRVCMCVVDALMIACHGEGIVE